MEKNNNFIISYNENAYMPVDTTISFEQKLRDTAKDLRFCSSGRLVYM